MYLTNVVIANGASLSSPIDLDQQAIVGIEVPSAWTAASLTFAASQTEGGTYVPVYDAAGTELTIVAGTSRCIVIAIDATRAFRWVKLRSGLVGAAVNQGAARTLAVYLAPMGT